MTTETRARIPLKAEGIETRRFYRPIHSQPCYRSNRVEGAIPVSEYISARGLVASFFNEPLQVQMSKNLRANRSVSLIRRNIPRGNARDRIAQCSRFDTE